MVEFFEDQSVGLYNLEADPGETTNVAEKYPERAAELRAELDAWQAATKAPIPSVRNPECILD